MSEKAPISTSMRSEADQLAFIWKTVESIATCMMTTSDGPLLRSRPMRGYIRAKENAIYFITSRSTHKPEEIAAKPHVGLSFVDNASNTFISLSGPIVMIDDRQALDTLWSRADDAYFPSGSGDPDVMLLTFTPERGEYWDSPSNPVVVAIEFIRATVTGDKPSLGDNAAVAMRPSRPSP